MSGKKLLVADDSLTIQKVIRLALSNEGYEIQAVSDGNDVIQQISLFRPDIVLIDVSLPQKSAFEVKQEVNEIEELQKVAFILMSSVFEKVDEKKASEVFFHGRLTKPFDPVHLREVLFQVLQQSDSLNPSLEFQKNPQEKPKSSSVLSSSLPPPAPKSYPSNSPPPPPLPHTLSSHPFIKQKKEEASQPPPPPSFSTLKNFDPPSPKPSAPSNLPLPPEVPPSLTDLWEPDEFQLNEPSNHIPFHDDPLLEKELEEIDQPFIEQTPMQSFLSQDLTSSSHLDDIHELTQSTLQNYPFESEPPFASSEHSEWNIEEPSLKKTQNSPYFKEEPSSSFHFPAPPPLPSKSSDSKSSFITQNIEEEKSLHLKFPLERDLSLKDSISSDKEIEKIIQNEIKIAVEKALKELLPQIAEKLIKDEIHKMLSD